MFKNLNSFSRLLSPDFSIQTSAHPLDPLKGGIPAAKDLQKKNHPAFLVSAGMNASATGKLPL